MTMSFIGSAETSDGRPGQVHVKRGTEFDGPVVVLQYFVQTSIDRNKITISHTPTSPRPQAAQNYRSQQQEHCGIRKNYDAAPFGRSDLCLQWTTRRNRS
jgi:hypothetical protein